MKFNEPVRPAGIGRNQVAFDIGNKPTEITIIENDENDTTSPESQTGQDEAVLAQANAASRIIAYSAASSAMSNNQNEIWGLRGVADFTTDANGFGFVKWDHSGTKYRYATPQINNPFMYVDTEDPAKIRVNRPGWYLVDAMVVVENYKNASDYRMDILIDDTEIIVVGFDRVHTNQYPTLRVNAIVPVPAVVTDINPTSTSYFRVRWQAVGLSTATTIEADGFIHAIWLKPWEADETHANT
jgi:hypothetical protein